MLFRVRGWKIQFAQYTTTTKHANGQQQSHVCVIIRDMITLWLFTKLCILFHRVSKGIWMYFVKCITFYDSLKRKTEHLSDIRFPSAALETVETFTNNLWPCGVFRALVLVVSCASTAILSASVADYISQNSLDHQLIASCVFRMWWW